MVVEGLVYPFSPLYMYIPAMQARGWLDFDFDGCHYQNSSNDFKKIIFSILKRFGWRPKTTLFESNIKNLSFDKSMASVGIILSQMMPLI